MIADYNLEDLDIAYPIKDYGSWLIVEVRNDPPHISEYVLKGNRIYVCMDVKEVHSEIDDEELFKCKFDWVNSIFVDVDGQTLEVVTDPSNRNFRQSDLIDFKVEENVLFDYTNLLKQAIYGLGIDSAEKLRKHFFVFSTGENYHFTNEKFEI